MKGHIRQRSPGSWELRYDFGTDPATGKRRVATATVRGDRKAAEKELRRLLHTMDTGEHVDPTRLSVGQWLEQWLETVRAEVAPKTHERYGEIVRNFLIPQLGQSSASEAGADPYPNGLQRTGPRAAAAMARPAACPRRRVGTSTAF